MQQRTHSESVTVAAPPGTVYALVSDIERTGEWSPTCVRGEWDDARHRGVGAQFTGFNETANRTWETRSTVVAADPGRRFAWEVGHGFVRWSYELTPVAGGTEVTERWTFLPAGLEYFTEKFGDRAAEEIDTRTAQAHRDIGRTLAKIKQIVEV